MTARAEHTRSLRPPRAGKSTLALILCAGLLAAGSCAPAGCSSTNDVIGFNHPPAAVGGGGAGGAGGAGAAGGAPVPERTYPNLFHDLLGKSDTQITNKLEAAYQQLFHGDAATQAIFVAVSTTEAYLLDPRANEIRGDGFANALLVSVELDHETEFDQLWQWADAHLVAKTGPLRDYFRSRCLADGSACYDEVQADPHFCAATALWLADGRWGSAGAIDYGAAATRLTAAAFRTEAGASSSLGALVGLVDPALNLPRSTPYEADSAVTATAAMEPAYFGLWAEKMHNAQATALAANARSYWATVADASTGLIPAQASPAGVIATGDDVFGAGSFPVLVALALDSVWFQKTAFHVTEADRMLSFFHAQPSAGMYATSYSLSGTAGSALTAELSLAAPLGGLAVPASVAYRSTFVQAVWNASLDTGTSRKFGNLLYMMSSLILAGQMRVY